MTSYDLPPKRAATLRRAETLARKVNLLHDVIMSDTGKPFEYLQVRDAAQEAGYYISRTRWSLLRQGKEQVMTDDALRAIATVFDVDAEYLLQDDGELPVQVEAELELIKSLRRAEVLNFAARLLGPVDPETLREIAKLLEES